MTIKVHLTDTRPPQEVCPLCRGTLIEQRLKSSCSRCGLLYETCCDMDPPAEV